MHIQVRHAIAALSCALALALPCAAFAATAAAGKATGKADTQAQQAANKAEQQDEAQDVYKRQALYGALYGVFANEPSAELLASLEGTELQTLVDALMGERGAKPLAALAEAAARAQGAGEASVDRLEGAYNRLFVGPAKPEAGPWESLHRGKEGTLFCQTTLDVRRCYVEQGLIPQSYPYVADDHVALEIDFVRRLGERARDAWAAGDRDAAAGALAASREFLSDHLGVWVRCV